MYIFARLANEELDDEHAHGRERPEDEDAASPHRYGTGEQVLPDGDVYEGKYKDGLQEGHGVYTFVDGRKYDGQWVKGMMHGTGAQEQQSNSSSITSIPY